MVDLVDFLAVCMRKFSASLGTHIVDGTEIITTQERARHGFKNLIPIFIAFAHFGREVDGEEMALRYQDYISQQGQTFPGAEDLLAELVERGYQLYGATNGVTDIQQGRLKQSAITPYFKEIFISEQLGTQKPEVAFYEKISNLIPGFAKEQALMIGDSLTADIAGGNAAGIDTVWYNLNHKENTSPAVPTYEVDSYEALLALLRKD